MFIGLLVLTVLCGIALIVGFVLLLTSRGQTTRRTGAEVGAEVFSEMSDDDDEDEEGGGEAEVSTTVAEVSTFRGKGVAVGTEASISFAEIKQQIAEGRWNEALPGLLALVGLTGLLLFGSLALLVRMENKLVGVLIVAFVVYTLVRALIGFVRGPAST